MPGDPPERYLRVVVILPVLNETTRIDDAVRFLSGMATEAGVEECVIVGTPRERDEAGRNPTLDAAVRATATDPRFRVIEADEPCWGKAHQVNFGVRATTLTSSSEQTWFFLIDIDTRFNASALLEARTQMQRGEAFIQQHSVFLADFATLPLTQKGHALYQSRWTLSHEIKNNTIAYRTGWYVSHIVGHGAYIQLSEFNALGGLPQSTVSEDLHFGYYVVASGRRIRSIRTLEMSDTPDTLSAAMAQQKTWAFGPLAYYKFRNLMKVEIPEEFAQNRLRSFIISMFGFATCLNWIFLFPALVSVFILAILGTDFAIATLLTYYIELTAACIFFRTRGWIRDVDVLTGPLLMVLHTFFRSLAAWRAVFQLFIGRPVTRLRTVNRAA